MGKLFCPKCKKEAEKIIEVYDNVYETREWNEESKIYELIESSLNTPTKIMCGECETEL